MPIKKMLLAVATVGCCLSVSASEIDTSFGTGGMYEHPNSAIFYASAVEQTGKQLHAGIKSDGGKWYATVIRLRADGVPDSAFGNSGEVALNLSGSSNDDYVYKLAVDSDGSIYLTGWKNVTSGSPMLATGYLAKLRSNGELDTAFAGDGVAEFPLTGDSASGDALVITANAIVVAGTITTSDDNDGFVLRYTKQGQLDSSFNGNGQFRLSGIAGDTMFSGAVQRPDGKLLLVGSAGSDVATDTLLLQLTEAGALDSSFAAGAGYRIVAIDGSKGEFGDEALILPDGKLLVSGATWPTEGSLDGRRAFVARFDQDGVLDTGFAGTGVLTLSSSDTAFGTVNEVLPVGDGRFWLSGYTREENAGAIVSGNDYQILTRIHANGSIDTDFVPTGQWQAFRFKDGYRARANSSALDVDGGVLIAGTEDGSATPAVGSVVRFTGANVDLQPNALTVSAQTGVEQATEVISAAMIISGLGSNVQVPAHVSGGELSVNGAAFSATRTWLKNGDSIRLRHVSSGDFASSVSTTLKVGGIEVVSNPEAPLGARQTVVFTSTTGAADLTPAQFGFTAQNDVAANAELTSNTVTIAGINAPAPVSIANGEYSIGCTAIFTTATSTISNGQSICVRHVAANWGGTRTTTLTVGTVSADFVSVAAALDNTPDAFSFASQSGVNANQAVTSAAAVVTGINAPVAISVSNGEYSIGCTATFTASAGTISNGQSVCVRHTPTAWSTTTTSTLTVGTAVTSFSSTTKAEPAASNPGGGGGGGGSLGVFTLLLLTLFTLRAVDSRRR